MNICTVCSCEYEGDSHCCDCGRYGFCENCVDPEHHDCQEMIGARMVLDKIEIEVVLNELSQGRGEIEGMRQVCKTALALHVEVTKLKAERDNLQMTIRSLKMRGEDG